MIYIEHSQHSRFQYRDNDNHSQMGLILCIKINSCFACLVNGFPRSTETDFVVSIFVDSAKAFDVTDHGLLVRKLALYDLPPETLTLLTSFLTEHTILYVNAATSSVKSLIYGVHQGAVLSPLLFSICINDVHLFIKACFVISHG